MTDLQEKAMRMALEFIVLSSSKDRAWFTKKEFEVLAALCQALDYPTPEQIAFAQQIRPKGKSRIGQALAQTEKPPVKSYCGGKPNYCTPEQEPLTLLPDGSAFGVMSFPLPKSHWLYAEREYRDGKYEPVELGKPILTHELRGAVVSAVRYAIRGATNCGKEMDFDPDALVQNAVYALCGPYTAPPKREWVGLTDEKFAEACRLAEDGNYLTAFRLIQDFLKEKNLNVEIGKETK